jgi:hypothetical protein
MPEHSDQTPDNPREVIRTTIGLYEDDIAQLQLLAAIRNTTPAQVVREALATEVFVVRQLERGASFYIKEPSPKLSKARAFLSQLLVGPREVNFSQFEPPQNRQLNSDDIPS